MVAQYHTGRRPWMPSDLWFPKLLVFFIFVTLSPFLAAVIKSAILTGRTNMTTTEAMRFQRPRTAFQKRMTPSVVQEKKMFDKRQLNEE